MQNHLLLLEDVDNLARKGEVIKVKPGFARNYLLPKKLAVVVDKRTLRMQEKLREERSKQAIEDKKASLSIKKEVEGKTLEVTVKVDQDGHMYGSVSANDIIALLEKEGFKLSKRNVKLARAIKSLGIHEVTLTLKEGVEAKFALKVKSDIPIKVKKEEKKEEAVEETVTEEETPSEQ